MISERLEQRLMQSMEYQAAGVANELIDSANMLMSTGAIADPANRKMMLRKR